MVVLVSVGIDMSIIWGYLIPDHVPIILQPLYSHSCHVAKHSSTLVTFTAVLESLARGLQAGQRGYGRSFGCFSSVVLQQPYRGHSTPPRGQHMHMGKNTHSNLMRVLS